MPKHEDNIGPAYVLRDGTDELKKFLDTSVSEICNSLRAQIFDLVTEPSSAQGAKLSAQVEFTRAKFKLFTNISTLVDSFVENTKEQLDDMHKAFLERVEVFLANTKLEVKLPSSSEMGSAGRWSPKSRQDSPTKKSPSPTKSSLYPTMLNAAKNIPLLNSFLPSRDEANASFSRSPTKQKDKKQSVRFLDDSSSSLHTPIESRIRGRSMHSTSLVQPSPILKKTPRSITPIFSTLPDQPTSSTPRPQRSHNVVPPKAGAEFGRTTPKRLAKTSASASNRYVSDLLDSDDESDDDDCVVLPTSTSDAFHNVYSVGMDVNEDLDIYSDELPAKSPKVSRRKTITAPKVSDKTKDSDFISGSRFGKRKTLATFEPSGLPPSKRMKSGGGGRKSTGSTKLSKATSDSNLLEGERADAGHYKYTPWMSLKDIDGKVPTQPGVFELKVLQAKKPAFIGSCDSLRQHFTLYKLAQNSGNKLLDKFIDRNSGDVMIRYETISTLAHAKTEEKNRVKSFLGVHKKMPAFN